VERARSGDRLLSDNCLTTFRAGRIGLAVRVEPPLHQLAFTLRRCGWMEKRQYSGRSIDQPSQLPCVFGIEEEPGWFPNRSNTRPALLSSSR
jgi:hypothetical protein